MPLFPGIVPKAGEIYICNFSGYVVPEMVKMRRVVVLSPPNSGARVVLVAPISTTAPREPLPVHVELPGEAVYQCFAGEDRVWVKCDLVAHVRFDRLDRVRIPCLDAFGFPIPRKFEYIRAVKLTRPHFADVRRGVLHALGLGRLAEEV